jgi:anti-sigma regulatory factor (Ser/Thr protein kinase)
VLLKEGSGLSGQLDMVLANDLQEVARVIDRLEVFCADEGIILQQGLRFCLALDELITNILSYGLAGRGDGVITLSVEHRAGALHAELADNGPPFDPLAAAIDAPSGSIEERDVGGLGIALVKAVMDRLEYRHDGGFNRLCMEMKIQAA